MNLAQMQVQIAPQELSEYNGQQFFQQNQNQMYQYLPESQQQYQQSQLPFQQQGQHQSSLQTLSNQQPLQQNRNVNNNQVLIEQQQPQYLTPQLQDIAKQQAHYQKSANQINPQYQPIISQQNQPQLFATQSQQQMKQPLIQKQQFQQAAQQFQASPEKNLKGQASPQPGRYQQYSNQAVGSPNNNNNNTNQLIASHQKKPSISYENMQSIQQSPVSNIKVANNPIQKPPLENQFSFFYSVPKLIEPNPLDCVLEADNELGGLFIGNLDAALSVEILKKNRIRAVLTTSIETGFRYAEESIHFHESLPAHDKEGYDITIHFEKGIEFIERNRKYTSVLVHCFAGVSRSASICIAYMMKKNRWNLEMSLWHLKKCRRLINPNTGFIKKLTQYEQHLILKGHFQPQKIPNNGILDANLVIAVDGQNPSSGNVLVLDKGGFYQQNGQILSYNIDNQSDITAYSDPNNFVNVHLQPNPQQQIMLKQNQNQIQQQQQQGTYAPELVQPQFQQIGQQQSQASIKQQKYSLQQQQNIDNNKQQQQYLQQQQQQQQQQPLSVVQQVQQLKLTQYPKTASGGQQQQQFQGSKQQQQGVVDYNQQGITHQQPQQGVGIQILANNEQFVQEQKVQGQQEQADNPYFGVQQQSQQQQKQQQIGYQNQPLIAQQNQGVFPQQAQQSQFQQQAQQHQYQQQSISQQVQNKQQLLYKQSQLQQI